MNPLKGPSLFVSATTLVGLDCVRLKSISSIKVIYAQFMTKICIQKTCFWPKYVKHNFGEKTNLWQKMGVEKLDKGGMNFGSI